MKSSARKPIDKICLVGILTGRPAEEMPVSMGDQLPELLQLLERVRQALTGVVQALWPSLALPEGLGGVAEKNTQLSQELQECKGQLEAALSGPGGNTGTSPGNALF